ncbi:MAG: serine/threonine protein kinase [Planctomycetales bacterium]|nr:serine/threonine protein kinase [Planctomycetales bacterium]
MDEPHPTPAGKKRIQLPGFRIESVLGRGAQGVVVKAVRERDKRRVAVKILSGSMAKVSEFRKRFRREASVAMEIQHPNVVAGLEVGQVEGLPFVVMEYVDGETLGTRFGRGTMTEPEVLSVAKQIGSALACAHERGLVHRDIKPDNIMLGKDGVAKLMDLGLAKESGGGEELTVTGSVFGTPGYLSPEGAVDSKDTDIRSDIYSLGCTLYRALAGEPPFTGKTITTVLTKMLTLDPVPPRERNPAVSEGLDLLVLKMIARDRRCRYQTPEDLLEDVARLERGEPLPFTRDDLKKVPGERKGGPLGRVLGLLRRLWPFGRRG